jgi:hypothetical protein
MNPDPFNKKLNEAHGLFRNHNFSQALVVSQRTAVIDDFYETNPGSTHPANQ